MRVLALLSLFVFSGFLPNSAAAEAFNDGFGDRFYSKAPAGLGDYTAEITEIPDIAMDEMAEDLQKIMPAAGDSEDVSETEEVKSAE